MVDGQNLLNALSLVSRASHCQWRIQQNILPLATRRRSASPARPAHAQLRFGSYL